MTVATPLSLQVLQSAYFEVGQELVASGGQASSVPRITSSMVLVRHPQGNVLIDTGVPAGCITDPDTVWGTLETRVGVPVMEEWMTITNQLAEIELTPKDINFVLLTHLHQDHTGGNLELPESTFFVQKSELEFAAEPDIPRERINFRMAEIAPDRLRYEIVTGEIDVFGDGSIVAFPTPGHTPGHQSVIVRLPDSGPVIVTGDAIAQDGLLDEMTVPAFSWCTSNYCRSRRKLCDLADREGAQMLHGHQPNQFDLWERSPHRYS